MESDQRQWDTRWLDYDYLSGYKPIPKTSSFEEVLQDLNKQAGVISKLFGIKQSFDIEWAQKAWVHLPDGAEKLFLIPKWEKIFPAYGESIQNVFNLLKQERGGAFQSYKICGDRLGPRSLRQSAKLLNVWRKLSDEQGDHAILLVPAQFGLWRRGYSVHQARDAMDTNECGLGAFAIGAMLLTHPERLRHYDDLWIDCAGEDFAPLAGKVFSRSPYFRFYRHHGGGIRFGARELDEIFYPYGAASMFLPQG